MASGPTRRTHIVRISPDDATAAPDDPPSETYIDVEVLDAIAFRTDRGEEMILSLSAKDAVPYIVDDTGGDHGKTPGSDATQRSHMKRIVSGDQKLDIEVIEAVAFRDKRGEEWILDMHDTNGDPSVFNTTDDTGDNKSTRRTHTEKIGIPFTEAKPTDYIKSERCDAMAFRTILGKELIVKCPSNDDPNSSDPRAETHVWSPEGYDPSNDDGPKPPKNTDPHNYVSFVKDAAGFTTGDKKISMGPLWWIRKISQGGAYLVLDLTETCLAHSNTPPPAPTISVDFGNPADKTQPHAELLDRTDVITQTKSPTINGEVYFVWNSFAPFPDQDTWSERSGPFDAAYAAQFAVSVVVDTGILVPRPSLGEPPNKIGTTGANGGGDMDTGGNYRGNGLFPDLAHAAYFANVFNAEYDGHSFPEAMGPQGMFTGYYPPGSSNPAGGGGNATVFATSLNVTPPPSSNTTTRHTVMLIKLPNPETVIKVNVSGVNGAGGSIAAIGYSDTKKLLKVFADTHAESADAEAPDDVLSADTPSTGANYTITTKVVKNADPDTLTTKAHHAHIVIAGGGSGGGVVGGSG